MSGMPKRRARREAEERQARAAECEERNDMTEMANEAAAAGIVHRTDPSLRTVLSRSASDKNLLSLSNRQIEAICKFFGDGSTPIQRRRGIALLWHKAWIEADSKMIAFAIKEARMEQHEQRRFEWELRREARERKRAEAGTGATAGHTFVNVNMVPNKTPDLRDVKSELRAARYEPTVPGLPDPVITENAETDTKE